MSNKATKNLLRAHPPKRKKYDAMNFYPLNERTASDFRKILHKQQRSANSVLNELVEKYVRKHLNLVEEK